MCVTMVSRRLLRHGLRAKIPLHRLFFYFDAEPLTSCPITITVTHIMMYRLPGCQLDCLSVATETTNVISECLIQRCIVRMLGVMVFQAIGCYGTPT
ncbi:hypothetical protein TNCV_754211 [Trichonephila clavipes]|nr:hypothetical protein TNCV_754211 [Trichonephila clavipes]